nr:hypothetical protein [Enterocloster clostridioformis]
MHALISEGGAGNFTPWRPNTHFDYDFLRLAFRKVLLEQLSLKLGPPFKKVSGLGNSIKPDFPLFFVCCLFFLPPNSGEIFY